MTACDDRDCATCGRVAKIRRFGKDFCSPHCAASYVAPEHTQESHGSDYGAFLTCAECAGEVHQCAECGHLHWTGVWYIDCPVRGCDCVGPITRLLVPDGTRIG